MASLLSDFVFGAVVATPPAGAGGIGGAGVAARLLILLALVLVNAFFVAAEFALVGTRRSRIQKRIAAGDRTAKLVERTLKDLDRYISVTQVGITLASLALGWFGADAIAVLVDNVFAEFGWSVPAAAVHTTAAAIAAFAIIAFLHIVLGHLTPKTLALVRPERTGGLLVRPLIAFSVVVSPFVALLDGAANGVLRMLGVRPSRSPEPVHSPEELRLLVMQSRAHGALDESDSLMLAGVFDFHEKRARDVMRPRTEIVAIPVDASETEVWQLMRAERYSRYPVYHESLDDVVGVLVAKDLWLKEARTPFDLRTLIRKPLYVPDNRPAE